MKPARFLALLVCTAPLLAQDPAPSPAAAAAAPAAPGPNEKAAKYLDALLKRPASTALFDRFHNAWLDTATLDDLDRFLTAELAAHDDLPHRLVFAQFNTKHGDLTRALAQLQAALAQAPGSAETWFQQASLQARLLDFDHALASLARTLEAKPEPVLESRVLQLQGQLLARSSRVPEALEAWKKLAALHPDDLDLREDLIDLQVTENLLEPALEATRSLVEATADPLAKLNRRLRLGDLLLRADKRDEALKVYDQCLRDSQTDSWLEREVLKQIESPFRRADDLDGLQKHVEALVADSPRRLALRRLQADLLAQTGQGDAALKIWRESILPLAPGDVALREAFLDLLGREKKTAEAILLLRDLISQHPDMPALLLRLADLQQMAGDKAAAKESVTRWLATAQAADPASPQPATQAARLLEQYGQADDAAALLEQAFRSRPGDEAARDTYASFLHRTGKKEQAVTLWRDSVKDATDPAALHRASRVLHSRGESAAAWEVLHQHLELVKTDPQALHQYCDLALLTGHHAEGIPHALDLLRRTTQPRDYEPAAELALRLVQKAESAAATLKSLQSAPALLPPERCFLAEMLDLQGDLPGTRAALDQAEKDSPLLALSLGLRLATTRQDFPRAAALAARLLDLDPADRAAHLERLIDLLKRSGDTKGALARIPDWKKHVPGSARPWLAEVDLLRSLGRNRDALETLRRANQAIEKNAELRLALARGFTDEGRHADARRLYEQFYDDAADPAEKIKWAGDLATAAQAQGRLTELVDQFQERRRQNRTSLVPLLALAEIHRVAEQIDPQREALTAAIRLKPDDLDLQLRLITLEENAGNFPAAITLIKAAQPLDKSGRLRSRLASDLLASGDAEGAQQLVLEHALAPDATVADAESDALTLFATEDWPAVLKLLPPLIEHHPASYRLRYLQALALEEDGKSDEAIHALAALLAEKPEAAPPPPPLPPKSRPRPPITKALSTATRTSSRLAASPSSPWR